MGALRDFSSKKNASQDSIPEPIAPIREMMKSRRKLKFRDYILLSLLLHTTLTACLFVSMWRQKPKRVETVQMEILETPPAMPATVATARQKPPEIVKNLVVDQDEKPLNDEVPDDARFLSKNNQVVKKQTMAQARGEFKNKATKDVQQGEKGATAKKPSLQDFTPKFDIAKSVEQQQEREREFEKSAEDGIFKPKTNKQEQASAKKGDSEQPQSKGGDVSQTLDYVKDLDPGLETLLSTKEFVYYSYFNRIRGRLNQYWTDKVRQKLSDMYKRGRMIASTEDKVTKCLITLDTTGRLLKVQIIGDSGIHELDEAAVEAFRAAAPFLNPPKGMIDPDGTIKIRWDFILEA